MTLPVDYSNDWQFADGVETVTITPKHPAAVAYSGLKAVRTSTSEAAASLGGDYGPEPKSVTFYVWTAGLGSYKPNQGDTVTDDSGQVWIVQLTSYRSDASQWSLSCVAAT